MNTPLTHRLIRALLALPALGERRDDIVADVIDLFEARIRARGRLYASWRLFTDILSVLTQRRPDPNRRASRERSRTGSGVLTDLRYGLRLFAKHPAVIGATVGGLALAIAVSTTVFTILNATVLRPYGIDDPGTVVRVQKLIQNGTSDAWPYSAFAEMRDRARQARVEAFTRDTVRFSLSPGETAGERRAVQLVSGGYLPLLGGRAVRGRSLQPSDDVPGAAAVVVLNHRFWTTRLDSDADIVGRTIWLSGAPVTVVGVLEPAFTGPVDQPPSMWAPLGSYAAISGGRAIDRASPMLVTIVARTSPDLRAATHELSAIATGLPVVDLGLRSETGDLLPVTGVRLDQASSPMAGQDRAQMLMVVGAVLGIVGLVVALACVNVANLMLAGAASRAREIGVRLALGASRSRVLRQLLTESALMSLTAGAAGLLLSTWLVPFVTDAASIPDMHDVRPDAAVLLFTAALAVLSGLGAGLAPARHGARGDLTGVLKAGGSTAGAPLKVARMRRWFIGFQAAASILLLVMAALFVRGAVRLTHIDLGFDADKLVSAAAMFPREDDRASAGTYWQTALEHARALPSVEAASLVRYPPFSGAVGIRHVQGLDMYRIYENRTDAGYFDTAGFRLVRGRAYTVEEARTNAPVAVVSESIVRDFLGGLEPIGASLAPVSDLLAEIRVVGVVAEAVTARIHGRGNGAIYRPLPPADLHEARLVVRTAHPAGVARDLEKALLSINPRVRPFTRIVRIDADQHMNEPKLLAGLSGGIAGLALLLSVLGLFGVATFVVSQRMWEMQVRRAIGASAGDIVRLVLRQSLMPVAIGLAAGLAVALAAVRVLTPALSGVSPYDPAAILGALVVLVAAAVAAVLSPAIRAARTNPASVLRSS